MTTGAGTTVTGGFAGVFARDFGSGALDVTANGDVTGINRYGIIAQNFHGTNLSVTTGPGTTVTGVVAGIFARNFGSGRLDITVNGDVTGTNHDGIYARALGPVAVTVGSASTVTSNGVGSTDFAIETSGPSANVTIAGTVNGGGGGAISLGPGNDRLELQPGAVVNGLVLGGVGTDSFVLGGTGTASFDVGLIGTQHQSFELFSKEAASHWTLTGTNAGISNWAVNGGLLSVNAAMPNTAFAVNAGTLGGVGTIGAFTAFAGGTVAPGNGIGTLNVVGNVAFNAGSFYAVEVDPAGNSDKVLAGGTATLSGGTVQVLAQSGTYNLCDPHRQSRRRGHVRWCHEQFRAPDADT